MERTQRGEMWGKEFFGDDEKSFKVNFFKAIYANEAEQQKVLDTSLRRNDEIHCDTKVLIVDGEERKKASLTGIASVLARANTIEPAFCMGVPTTVKPLFNFRLEQRYNQNILVAGRNGKISNDLLTEFLMSSVLKRNIRTVLLADPREQKLFEVKRILDHLGLTNMVEIYTDYGQICELIKSLHDQVKQRQTLKQPTLLMWLGMVDLYDEFGTYQENEPPAPAVNQESFELNDEKAIEACQDKELIEKAQAMGVSVQDLLTMLGMAPAEEMQSMGQEATGRVYNAIADIGDLLKLGARYSLYHVVSVESPQELERERLKNVKPDYFIHKFGYKMSPEDSYDFGFGRKANEIPDEEMALYSNGVKSVTFKPFLLK